MSANWWADAPCESGWTGDRCTFPLFHEGPHSNEAPAERLPHCTPNAWTDHSPLCDRDGTYCALPSVHVEIEPCRPHGKPKALGQ